MQWLSQSVAQLGGDKAGIVKVWEETRLLLAWERATQVEAVAKTQTLFPGAVAGGAVEVAVPEADEAAGAAGVPFMQTEHDEDWQEWVDWAAVEGQTVE